MLPLPPPPPLYHHCRVITAAALLLQPLPPMRYCRRHRAAKLATAAAVLPIWQPPPLR
jgi:hypothetical protein